ncbi:MAG TPA: hypothetical protein VEU62_00835 [Bryobacterales bacterium]|nr:hypothetical protein [Bryobacterales bacterium]
MNVNKALADVLKEIEQLEEVARALERLARSRGKRGRMPAYALAREGEKRTLKPPHRKTDKFAA